ncbi:PKD domain containing protein [Psychromonas ingrahamii 37]|uniref:PKD domain containing protein n=1 Tax=Psychromonas ingrahamii (strain DSM 17664 / CCUG 51855 / 37) TaxID=357804 RepID=A1SSA2_PSYIN|nr:FG-GAP repeat protein [Psychromonas ingrahamii]ABM02367.1 PKD domain containing protein [Psychromonas ingrahamii 37]
MFHLYLSGLRLVAITFLSLIASASWAALTPVEVAKILASDGAAYDYFGYSVALSGDTAVIGAGVSYTVPASGPGAAYVYTRNGTSWSEQAKLTASDGSTADNFGYSVAIDGDTIVVGARFADGVVTDAGAVYVYTRSGTVWSEQAKITASDGQFRDFFGNSLAIYGDNLAIGAYGDDNPDADAGSVYIYTRSGTTWNEQAKLRDSDGLTNDRFGWAVDLFDDTALIGTVYDDDNGTRSGSAFVFTRSGTTWSEQAKLQPDDSKSYHFFGVSVALSADTALIGTNGDADKGLEAGAAYVFVRSGALWSQQAKLIGSDVETDDESGWSVALSGDTALVSAIRDDDNGTDSGAVYIFARNGTIWSEQAKIKPGDGAYRDFFSFSMGLSGDTALIAANLEDDNGADAGAAYIFTGVTGNTAPVAEAGLNQSIHVGQNVALDGSGSTDDKTASEDLLYDWTFDAKPPGSPVVLTNADTVTPSFIVDLPGDYLISLVVTDQGALSSLPDIVTVSSLNTPPVANAGFDRGSYVGETVVLDGSASFDSDSDALTFLWTLTAPTGSSATLSDNAGVTPELIPDLAGAYTAELVVSDGYADSTPDEVNIAVITTEQYVQQQAMESLNIITVLSLSSVTTSGNQTAMENFLLQAIDSLQKSKVDQTRQKLEKAIARTDGCALRGSPDTAGGATKDYISNCVDQNKIYPLLVSALAQL